MDVVELIPGLYHLRFPVGHAYLWCAADELTLIDTSLPGSAAEIAEAVRAVGRHQAELHRVVLTHFHPDHSGSAANIAAWGDGDVEICAHHADAPFLRGERQGPPPDLADWERPLWDQVQGDVPTDLPPMPPVPVNVDLTGGDVLDFAGGARVVEVAGHTPGSIAVLLPHYGVLIAGDAAATRPNGQVMPGVFNADRTRAAHSFQVLAGLDADIACFGHGDPLLTGAARTLRDAARRLADS